MTLSLAVHERALLADAADDVRVDRRASRGLEALRQETPAVLSVEA